MATSKAARDLVERIIREGRRGGDMRFDLDCRVEVWVTADDIESDPRYRKIVNTPGLDAAARTLQLKALAAQLAANKISGASETAGLEITCDGPALSDVNIDRINWNELAWTAPERQAAEDAEFGPQG